ncbi:hypothetical protein TorRG33x02_078010, partial [Trema orientale]
GCCTLKLFLRFFSSKLSSSCKEVSQTIFIFNRNTISRARRHRAHSIRRQKKGVSKDQGFDGGQGAEALPITPMSVACSCPTPSLFPSCSRRRSGSTFLISSVLR